MKKAFQDPDIQIVTFSVEDIITASGGSGSDFGRDPEEETDRDFT